MEIDPATQQALVDAVINSLEASGALDGSILTTLLGTAGGGSLIIAFLGLLLKSAWTSHSKEHEAIWSRQDETREKVDKHALALTAIETSLPYLTSGIDEIKREIKTLQTLHKGGANEP